MIHDLDGDNKRMGMDQMQMIQDLRVELLASINSFDSSTRLANTTMGDLIGSIKGLKPIDEAAVENLSLKLTGLSTLIFDFAQHSRAVASEQAILKSLRFNAMRVRHSQIVDAQVNTFDWIFKTEPSPEHDTIAFNDWLENQCGLYWIEGKAGSGKSTLMKFLYKDRRTQRLLQRWCTGRKLVTAQFFFWNAGTMMQKSQEGLLQSLLYEVLRQCPGMLKQVCSSRWLDYEHYGDEPDVWTRIDLLQAFESLLNQEEIPANFCFFIDGLDEYDGDHAELIEILNRWPVSQYFKLCVSSRPWYVFKDAFGQDVERHLTLETYTRHDIQSYIRKTFDESKRFNQLKARDPRYDDLVRDIDDKAQGVFLWVYLVVRELLKGFTNADTISVLQRRLEALPPKLEDYFRHMFHQIEEIYRKETVQTFKIALEARDRLPLMLYSFLYEDTDVLRHKTQMKYRKRREIEFEEDEMKRRLDGCCRGLLEVQEFSGLSHPVVGSRYVVGFLHRTTRDFLLTKEMQLVISNYVGQDFNPRSWLSNAFLYHLNQAPRNLDDATRVAKELIFYCKVAEVDDSMLQADLLDQAEQNFISHAGLGGRASAKALFASITVKGSLLLYTAHKLERSPEMVHIGDGLLDFALAGSAPDEFNDRIDPQMVQLLLEHGASPNQKKGDTTVWKSLVQTLHKGQLRYGEDRSLLETFDLMLQNGANLNTKIFISSEYKVPKDTGRASDLHRKGETIKKYKATSEVLRDKFGEKDFEWLLSRAQSPQTQKVQAQVVQKSGFFSFLGW